MDGFDGFCLGLGFEVALRLGGGHGGRGTGGLDEMLVSSGCDSVSDDNVSNLFDRGIALDVDLCGWGTDLLDEETFVHRRGGSCGVEGVSGGHSLLSSRVSL